MLIHPVYVCYIYVRIFYRLLTALYFVFVLLPSTLHSDVPSLNTGKSPVALLSSVEPDKGKAGVSCRWKVTLMMMKVMKNIHGDERVINLGNTVGLQAQ